MNSLELALSRVTIEDILNDAGAPIGRRNRTACPLHRGNNKTAFSFTEYGFFCHSCGAKGGILDLIQALHGMSRQDSVRHLFHLAGLPYEERKAPERTDFPVHQFEPRVSQRAKASPEYTTARRHLESLETKRRSLEDKLRSVRRAAKESKLPLADFYFQEQMLNYELEELDTEIAFEKATVNKMKKSGIGKQNESLSASSAI